MAGVNEDEARWRACLRVLEALRNEIYKHAGTPSLVPRAEFVELCRFYVECSDEVGFGPNEEAKPSESISKPVSSPSPVPPNPAQPPVPPPISAWLAPVATRTPMTSEAPTPATAPLARPARSNVTRLAPDPADLGKKRGIHSAILGWIQRHKGEEVQARMVWDGIERQTTLGTVQWELTRLRRQKVLTQPRKGYYRLEGSIADAPEPAPASRGPMRGLTEQIRDLLNREHPRDFDVRAVWQAIGGKAVTTYAAVSTMLKNCVRDGSVERCARGRFRWNGGAVRRPRGKASTPGPVDAAPKPGDTPADPVLYVCEEGPPEADAPIRSLPVATPPVPAEAPPDPEPAPDPRQHRPKGRRDKDLRRCPVCLALVWASEWETHQLDHAQAAPSGGVHSF